MNYYNDNDPDVCATLRNMVKAGDIPPGDVDERSITEVTANDIEGYTQVHLFAGFAGWIGALDLSGWPTNRPVWSASCPCPPFSVAGKQQLCQDCASKNLVWCPRRTGFAICADCGREWFADARHLWPEVWRLAAELRPSVIFGEQVESPTGMDWLAGVRGSLEVLGFAVGSSDLAAAGVGAPHKRARLFWVARRIVADADLDEPRDRGVQPGGRLLQPAEDPAAGAVADTGRGSVRSGGGSRNASQESGEAESQEDQRQRRGAAVGDCGAVGAVGNAKAIGRDEERQDDRGGAQGSGEEGRCERPRDDRATIPMADSEAAHWRPGTGRDNRETAGYDSYSIPLADAERPQRRPVDSSCGDERRDGLPRREEGAGRSRGDCEDGSMGIATGEGRETWVEDAPPERPRGTVESASHPWDECVFVRCRDGRLRRIPVPESGIQPLAYGLPSGMAGLDPRSRRLVSVAGLDGAALKRAKRYRMIALRGAGNMIVMQEAAVFVMAYLETE